MISEDALADLLQLETYDSATSTWVPWFGQANSVSVQRGGKANGASATVDVGTLSAILINAGDPLSDTRLKPNVQVRLMRRGAPAVPVFTGRINDIATSYVLDKNNGELTTYVTLSATDAVSAHAQTTRYGAVTAGGVGYETWALRIIRLATSSVSSINPPADDSPVIRYGI